jgi:hypothetical protein
MALFGRSSPCSVPYVFFEALYIRWREKPLNKARFGFCKPFAA